ncbi:MAG TPA: LamG-like jellyroll fold domain-containing protein [Candidatus Kryptonia bacterium]|nr:LamG-like jellyroll fold domain-containing protein [Candidatus Kryptonia bacterium]
MTKPAVLLIAGACGVVSIVIAVNHFRTTEDEVAVQARVAALAARSIGERAGGEHAGWSAKPGPEGVTGAQGVGGATGEAVSRHAGSAGGGSAAAVDAGGSAGAERSAATVLTGQAPAGGGVGFSGSRGSATGGGSSIRLSAPEAPVKFQGAGQRGGTQEQMVVASAAQNRAPIDPNKPAEDPNEPVLSLPLDRTVEPEKGDAPVAAQGITFDSGTGAKFAADAQFVIPNAGGLSGEAGTISFNLENDWTGNDNTDASLLKIRNPNDWSDRIEITKNGQYLRMGLWDDAGNESGVSAQINWQPGEQHQITTSWGDGVVTMSVDGRPVGQSTYADKLVFAPGTPMYVGSDVPGGQGGARGTMSDIKVYNTKQ